MAGAGYKTFTAGEVLTASDVNTFLMQQSVQNYGGTAARSSAIPSPSTGMVSYIGTTGTATIPQLEVYTGSAWQAPYGLTLLANVTMSAATVASISSVFSTTYDTYRIIIAGKAVSSSATITYQNLLAGTPAATNYRYSSWYAVGATSGVNHFSSGTTSAILGYLTTGSDDLIVFDVTNPALAKMTNGNTQINYGDATMTVGSVLHTTATAYDGFRISSNQNVNATIRVYGYRNS